MPLRLFEYLRDGHIKPNEILKNQSRFKSDLSEIKAAGKQSTDQKNTINNITNFFDLREKIIDFFKDYSFFLSEVSTKQNMEKELKILTPKQMCQRLLIALAQIKAGNSSESLLNEIR